MGKLPPKNERVGEILVLITVIWRYRGWSSTGRVSFPATEVVLPLPSGTVPDTAYSGRSIIILL